jgi:hypothetical protein
MMTEDQIKATRFLQERIAERTASLERTRVRLEWHKKAGTFAMKKLAEFHQIGEFGAGAAFEAGRRARAEFVALHGECPPTEYEFSMKGNP